MSETQTSTNDTSVPEPQLRPRPSLRLRDLRATESMASFFDEYMRDDTRNAFIRRPLTPNEASRRAVTIDEATTLRVPPLERLTNRHPSLWGNVSPLSENSQGLEPRASDPYIRQVSNDFDGDSIGWDMLRTDALESLIAMNTPSSNITANNISVTGPDGNRRFTLGIDGGRPPSLNLSGNLSAKHPEPSRSSFDNQIIKFLQEKVTLNLSLSQLSAGLEVKISLNLVDNGKELLSAEDFVRLD